MLKSSSRTPSKSFDHVGVASSSFKQFRKLSKIVICSKLFVDKQHGQCNHRLITELEFLSVKPSDFYFAPNFSFLFEHSSRVKPNPLLSSDHVSAVNKNRHGEFSGRSKDCSSISSSQPKEILIIGDSLLRNTWKWLNRSQVRVTCMPGVNNRRFLNYLNKIPMNVDVKQLVLHLGTNDLFYAKNPDYLIGNMWRTLETLKEKFPNAEITLSGIIKRRDVNTNYIKSVNKNIEWLCKLSLIHI